MNFTKKISWLFLIVLAIFMISCKEPTKPSGPVDPDKPNISDKPDVPPVEEGLKIEDVKKWLNDNVNIPEQVENDLTLPQEYQEAKFIWKSDNHKALLDNGKVIRDEIDQNVKLTCTITLKDKTEDVTYSFTVLKSLYTFEDVKKWLMDNYDGIEVSDNINLPKEVKEFNAELIWEIGESDYLDEDGNFTQPIMTIETDVFVTIVLNGKRKEFDLVMTLVGWGNELDVIADWATKQIPAELTTSIRFPSSHQYYKSTLTWESDNKQALNANGEITKDPEKDVEVVLTCTIGYEGQTKVINVKTKVLKLSDAEKNFEVRDWLDNMFKEIELVNSNLDLPTVYQKYNNKIEWKTDSPGVISVMGEFKTPMFDRVVELTATIICGEHTMRITYSFNTKGQKVNDVWEAVDIMLRYIANPRISNRTYYTFGGQEGYKKNLCVDYGYLYFYVNEKAPVVEEILEYTTGHVRTGIKKTSTEYIVVHDTWNTAPTATARAHRNYLGNLNKDGSTYISWHFTVDENETIQNLPLDEVAYHAGDGSHVYGDVYLNKDFNHWSIGGGNRNGIGIETCVNYGSDYTQTMRRCAQLIGDLLVEFNLGLDRVKQHNDFSGKNCPMVMRENGRWNEFLNMIEIEYFGKTVLKDVTFKWTSLSPDIMDNRGKIINHPKSETLISYQVEVTYKGETKTFTFHSILEKYEG